MVKEFKFLVFNFTQSRGICREWFQYACGRDPIILCRTEGYKGSGVNMPGASTLLFYAVQRDM